MKKTKFKKRIGVAVASVALLTASFNISPTFAHALSDVPIVGNVVSVLTFREYKVDDNDFNANIKVPAVTGLKNQELENSLNAKYLEENKKLVCFKMIVISL